MSEGGVRSPEAVSRLPPYREHARPSARSDNLLGYEPLARGNVNIYRGEVLAVFPNIGHGAADNEPLI